MTDTKELNPLFRKAGYQVYNCNAASKLTAFPHLPYEEALAASMAQIGNPSREKTEGMYSRVTDSKKAASQAETGKATSHSPAPEAPQASTPASLPG